MSEHRNEYTIREKDVSFRGQLRRLYKWAKKEEASGGRKEADTELAGLIRLIQE
jgi:hypothetical protein